MEGGKARTRREGVSEWQSREEMKGGCIGK